MQRRALVAGLVAAPAVALRGAEAQDAAAWPNRPLRLLVGFPPGGSVDTVARIVQPRLQAALGQPVVVENRPGATGSVAAAEAARSGADGHTWLFVSDSHAVIPAVMPLPYDARRDLTPVTLIGRGPLVIASHPSRPWRDFRDVVQAARERPPGAIHYATSIATMMHLATVRLCNLAGVQLTLVPYRGGAQALQDALAGTVPLFPTNAAVGGPHVRSGALRGLAVTARAPWRDLPGVPTLHDLGFTDFEAATWWAVVAPSGVPAATRRRMEAELSRVLAEPEVRARLELQGMDVVGLAGEEFARVLDAEMERWGRVVRENNIRIDG